MRFILMVVDEIGKIYRFKYLGSYLQKNENVEKDLKHRIMCGRIKWRGFMYDTECWAMDRKLSEFSNEK